MTLPGPASRFRCRPIHVLPLAALFLLIRSWGFMRFLGQHPEALSLDTGLALAGFLLDAGWTVLVFMGFFHFGRIILDKWVFSYPQSSAEDTWERIVPAMLLGEGVTALLILGAGLAGFFKEGFFWAVFAVLAWGAWRERGAAARAVSRGVRFLVEPVSWWTALAAFAIAAGLLRGLIAGGAPPTDWDSISYHLALPKLFLRYGDIRRLPWSANAHYPLNTEMIYALALAVRSDLAAQWVNAAHAVLLLILVGIAARRWWGRETGVLAPAVLAVQPVFQRVFGNAATDFSVGLQGLAAFYCFWRASESEESGSSRAWMLASGLFSGLALSAKITGAWVVGTILVLGAVRTFRRDPRALLLYAAGVSLLGSPWYLKNWVWTGNPVWPYLGRWFGASAADLAFWDRIRASVTVGIPKTWENGMLLPFKMISTPGAFLYGPQFLMAPFLALLAVRVFRRRFSASDRRALAALAVFGVFWFLIYQDWRYCMPVIGLPAILVADWAMDLWRDGFPWRAGALTLAFCFVPLKGLSVNNEAFVILGLRSTSQPELSARDRYLEWTLGPAYRLCRLANRYLPPDAKVLLFRDTRGYYLDRDYAWGDPLNPGVVSYAEIRDARQLRDRLKSLGFTHILYNGEIGNYRGDAEYYRRADALMAEVLARHSRALGTIPGFDMGLYEILPD